MLIIRYFEMCTHSKYSCLLQVLRPHSLLTNLVVDYEIVGAGGGGSSYYGPSPQRQQTCDDVFVYISDSASAAIVVYDVRNDAAWRVFHPSMLPHPDYSTYSVSMNDTPTLLLLVFFKSPNVMANTAKTHTLVPFRYAISRCRNSVIGTMTGLRTENRVSNPSRGKTFICLLSRDFRPSLGSTHC